MDKMSIWSVLFVSYPEVMLIIIITLTSAGYKEVLNFKEKANLFKLLIATSLIAAFAVIVRSILPSATLPFIAQVIFDYIIILLVYRYRAFACAAGLMLSLAILIVSESVLASLLLKTFSISSEQVYSNDLIRFFASLPDRIVQLAAVVIISRIRNINLTFEKLTLNEWVQISLFSLMVVGSMSSIEKGIYNQNNDINAIISLVANIVIAVGLCSWLIYNMFKLRKRMHVKENMYEVELHNLKQLLEDGRSDYAIELIDLTLKSKGYYNK